MDTPIMVSAGEFYKWLRVFKVVFGSASGGITINVGPGMTGGGFVALGGSVGIGLDAPGNQFVEVTGTTQAMNSNVNYSSNNASLVTLTLPATAALGDTITIYGKGAGGWKIAQNSGQQIILGEAASTVGVSGFAQSTYRYDVIKLTCITANTTWAAVSESGNITVS